MSRYTSFQDPPMGKYLKAILVGDNDVGKTSLVYALKNKKPMSNPTSTIGVEYTRVTIGKHRHIQFWDTAGQEKFRSILPVYFKKAQIALIVMDCSKNFHPENINYWLNFVRKECDAEIMIIGNKIDCNPILTEVNEMILNTYCSEHNLPYVLVSSLEMTNLESIIKTILNMNLLPEIRPESVRNLIEPNEATCLSKCFS